MDWNSYDFNKTLYMEPYKLLYNNDGICNIHVFEIIFFCFLDLCGFLISNVGGIHRDSPYRI